MTDEPKNYMAAEDMAAIDRALTVVRDFDMQGVQVVHHALPTVLKEYDRMKRRLEQISNGESVMILSDADRALPVNQLSDAALLAWVRPTLVFLDKAVSKIEEERVRGITPMVAMHGIISMALMVLNTNAGRGSFSVAGATDRDKELGDWRVIIERVPADEALNLRDVIADAFTAQEGVHHGSYVGTPPSAREGSDLMTLDGEFDMREIAERIIKHND